MKPKNTGKLPVMGVAFSKPPSDNGKLNAAENGLFSPGSYHALRMCRLTFFRALDWAIIRNDVRPPGVSGILRWGEYFIVG